MPRVAGYEDAVFAVLVSKHESLSPFADVESLVLDREADDLLAQQRHLLIRGFCRVERGMLLVILNDKERRLVIRDVIAPTDSDRKRVQ